jgi:RNA recognition motif-containing protein
VEFSDEKDAEEALQEMNNKSLGGLNIAIEWSKSSGRYDSKNSNRPPPR